MSAVLEGRDPQFEVTSYFEDDARFWRDIYLRNDVFSRIYQHRLAATLAWVDQLSLPASAPVLDLGCGAGLTAVALARRGFQVTALDSAEAMLDIARRAAIEAGVDRLITVGSADAHQLCQPDSSYRLVVALGLVPWLHTPGRGVQEMARVLTPGGHMIVTSDNRWRLTHLLDPLHTPLLSSPRRLVTKTFRRIGSSGLRARLNSRRELDQMLAAAGLTLVDSRSVGFGPFTLGGRRVLPEAAGVRFQELLQQFANAGVPGVRHAGTQSMVLARKELA